MDFGRAVFTYQCGECSFVRYKVPELLQFNELYFGMPVINAPFRLGQGQFSLISRDGISVFEETPLGFKKTMQKPLPPIPPKAALADLASDQQQRAATSSQAIGFQLDDNGSLYYVGSKRIFKQGHAGWKPWAELPEIYPGSQKNGGIRAKGAAILLPANRFACFCGQDAFVQFYEIDEGLQPKEIGAIPYASIGSNGHDLPTRARPSFSILDGFLYIYLQTTGHVFRIDLDKLSIKEVDTPWMRLKFGAGEGKMAWDSADHGDPSRPLIPDSIAFVPSTSGKLTVFATMFNFPFPAMKRFELDPSTNSIEAMNLTNDEIPKTLQFYNEKGELQEIPSTLEPGTNANPVSN